MNSEPSPFSSQPNMYNENEEVGSMCNTINNCLAKVETLWINDLVAKSRECYDSKIYFSSFIRYEVDFLFIENKIFLKDINEQWFFHLTIWVS